MVWLECVIICVLWRFFTLINKELWNYGLSIFSLMSLCSLSLQNTLAFIMRCKCSGFEPLLQNLAVYSLLKHYGYITLYMCIILYITLISEIFLSKMDNKLLYQVLKWVSSLPNLNPGWISFIGGPTKLSSWLLQLICNEFPADHPESALTSTDALWCY